MNYRLLCQQAPPLSKTGFHKKIIGANSQFSVEKLQFLGRDEIAAYQRILGHGDNFGIWETTSEMIGGRRLPKFNSSISFRDRLIVFLPENIGTTESLEGLLDEGVLLMSRYALLLRIAPSGMGRKGNGHSLDHTTIINRMQVYVPRSIAKGIERRLKQLGQNESGLLRHLTADDLAELSKQRCSRVELDRMRMLEERGLWNDAPPAHRIKTTTKPRGECPPQTPEKNSAQYLPLPDDFLAEMGPRVLWLVIDLGPNLIHLFESVPGLLKDVENYRERDKRISQYFKFNTWHDRNGKEITAPWFPLKIGTGKGAAVTSNLYEWPPRNWEHIQTLGSTLQAAHLWIALLAMGGRISEISTLKQDCVEFSQEGAPRVVGKTFKLSESFVGVDREWPAPEVLVHALGQQAQLVSAWVCIAQSNKDATTQKKETPGFLWASLGASSFSDPEDQLGNFSKALQTLAMRMNITTKPGGKNIHPHRFRKTIARLVGLAVTDSPRVLMRLLGHKDIEMTLHYILADKALQAEIDKVSRELRVMRCKDLLEEFRAAMHSADVLKHGGYGGGGASGLMEIVRTTEEALHRDGKEWDSESAYDLAVILTNKGQFYRVTKPGVICLKPVQQAGPCTCDSSCVNRIEEKFARNDIHNVIPILIEEGQRALAQGQFLLVADKVQQIEECISKFEDIASEFSNNHDIVVLRKAVA